MKYLQGTILICLLSIRGFSQLTVSRALCENKPDPNGVSLKGIRFSWELQARDAGEYQSAYELVIASSEKNLLAGQYDVYSSPRVRSRQSVFVPLERSSLQPGVIYYWKVRVWDGHGREGPWSDIRQFSSGLFAARDWQGARWIGCEELPDTLRTVPGVHFPFAGRLGNKCVARPVVPLFRKEFSITRKVRSAMAFVSGMGQYELTINGTKTGHSFLAPAWTYFDKTVLYNAYRVDAQLLQGRNAIGITVGNGFYNINRERYFKLVDAFGFPKLICLVKIVYDDGSEESLVSDESWKTTPSPITFSSIYGGEDYDGRMEQQGWNMIGFKDSNWKNALVVKAPAGQLLPDQDYPVAIMDSFAVRRISTPRPGVYLYDFGQNLSGIVRLTVKGKKGQQIKLIPAELLDSTGLANQQASGLPYYFSYTLKGDGQETWQPMFTYYGFRYVQVEGAVPDSAGASGALPAVIDLRSLHTRNSNPGTGSFQCSNGLFNRIDTLIRWAIKSNMQSVVTDCPHREKLSWLEEDYLMGASIHYNFDIYSLYRKLVNDLIDAQYESGFVPDIAPEYVVFDGGFLDSPEWGSSAVILPWLLYEWYGDTDVMRSAYPMMKKYVAYLTGRAHGHILEYGLGDWFDYGPRQPGESQLTPKGITSTCIYYYDLELLGKMAALMNKPDEAAGYRQLAATTKKAFNHKFFNSGTKVYATGSQTSMAMPYCVGIVEEKYKTAIIKNLVDSISANDKALTAGDIGFHFLIRALDKGGASQVIYDMNNRDDVPGYGYQLKKGATALTESWPALENVSNNHLMLGHIMEWFYSGLAGIAQKEDSPGFGNIVIRPQPVGNITWAKGSFHCPYGWIRNEWTKTGDHFTMRTEIPVNTSATVCLAVADGSRVLMNGKMLKGLSKKSGMASVNIGSGKYSFEVMR